MAAFFALRNGSSVYWKRRASYCSILVKLLRSSALLQSNLPREVSSKRWRKPGDRVITSTVDIFEKCNEDKPDLGNTENGKVH